MSAPRHFDLQRFTLLTRLLALPCAVLLGFAGTPEGTGSLARSPLEPVAVGDLESLERYALRLRRALAGA